MSNAVTTANVEEIWAQMVLAALHRLDLCNRLCSLTQHQREILVSGNHDDLTANVADQERLLADMSGLDRREARLREALGDSTPATTIEARLHGISEQTREAVMRLRSLTDTNAELLKNAAMFAEFSMGIVSQIAGDRMSYGPGGDDTAAAAIVLDRRA